MQLSVLIGVRRVEGKGGQWLCMRVVRFGGDIDVGIGCCPMPFSGVKATVDIVHLDVPQIYLLPTTFRNKLRLERETQMRLSSKRDF